MYLKMAKRVLRETDKRLVWKFLWNMGFKGVRSVQRFKNRLRRGEYFPPFIYLSIVNSCNLRCQGCWVDVSAPQQTLSVESVDRVIDEAKQLGNSFIPCAAVSCVTGQAVERYITMCYCTKINYQS